MNLRFFFLREIDVDYVIHLKEIVLTTKKKTTSEFSSFRSILLFTFAQEKEKSVINHSQAGFLVKK